MFSFDDSHDVMAVEIIGRAFLWHQVRCISWSVTIDSVYHEYSLFGRKQKGRSFGDFRFAGCDEIS